ncbi:hypothetical protein ACD591_19665 [Rufibacter glacialis]|uniref:LiaF transmembrane domain-containing protein n=1 Tax=Rufibacter glacialis TaxID=1259555 RepID=A0A5M8Q5V9_9BACT|nr:LiaF domain-containing protein [Rufibacter glacialis]KAA6430190.1 hypothetical protein FOE74_20450 [Rufibacter glacialis]GGK87160.1 hypothetical protein GCM10011405_38650 [Rufibacter glacialis]
MENQHIKRTGSCQGWGGTTTRGGRVAGGLLVVGIGAVLLAYQLNAIVLPRWVFSWKVLIIVIGLISGIRHSFRNPGWIFPVLIGGVFLLEDLLPGVSIKRYIWPAIIMAGGLWLIFKPRHPFEENFRNRRPMGTRFRGPQPPPQSAPYNATASHDDFLKATAIFGGIKKNVFTKDFKGGDIVTFCGGAEYNLTHADLQGEVIININEVFGGVSLIIPPHWKVRSEVVTVFGGIDDKRAFVEAALESDKVLILKGTVFFGGIELKSY